MTTVCVRACVRVPCVPSLSLHSSETLHHCTGCISKKLLSDLSMYRLFPRHPSVTTFIPLSVSSALMQRRRRIKACCLVYKKAETESKMVMSLSDLFFLFFFNRLLVPGSVEAKSGQAAVTERLQAVQLSSLHSIFMKKNLKYRRDFYSL